MGQLTAADLRKGLLVDIGGNICQVIHWNIWKSDRRSKIQLRFKDILTGRTSEATVQPDDRYTILESDVIEIEHSYKDGNFEVFYTKEGEEWRCPAAAVEDVVKWKADSYRGLLIDGNLVTVTAPASVICVVKDTTPPVKGVPNATKDALLENGMTVKVGMVINIGDKVRIDTETMEYKERVQ